ncbi:hypothetical protein [Pengzhenrongella frigida]|uniref:Uncharacterized protein n=1 Tax=Pengzhenrongella frigida TaxID=1259133 RepID=A0A4Q5N0S8_9MICO|nr:hypothetical protein [Cellulomonas sp. HLT2-17]RYV51645.1 hypothetical protein EUA98_06995 [Cellulomonas sp. HLT2-17]
MRWWKVLGVAGLAGVAATGVLVARSDRRRRAYTPEEIREQLHARLAPEPAPDALAGRLPAALPDDGPRGWAD